MADDSDDGTAFGGVAPSYPIPPALPIGANSRSVTSDGGIDDWQLPWSPERDALYPNDWTLPSTPANNALFPDDWQSVPINSWPATVSRSSFAFPLPSPEASFDPPIFLKNYLAAHPSDPWNNQTTSASSTPSTWDESMSMLYGITKLGGPWSSTDSQSVPPGLIAAPKNWKPPTSTQSWPGGDLSLLPIGPGPFSLASRDATLPAAVSPDVSLAPSMAAAQPIARIRHPSTGRVDLWDEFKGLPRGLLLGLSDWISAQGKAGALEIDGAVGGGYQGLADTVPGPDETAAILEHEITGELPRGGPLGTAVGRALGNPASYVGPGTLTAKMLGAAGAGIGGEIGGEIAGLPGSIVGSIIGGGARGSIGGRRGAGSAATREGEAAAPELPAFVKVKGSKTLGVLRTGAGDLSVMSGWSGPGSAMPKGASGFNIVTRTHAEGHAAALMHQNRISDATLYINNPDICPSCSKFLPRMLPPGARLNVITPSSSTAFVGISL